MSSSIPTEFIREIVDQTDIVSLIDSYLPLKKKGKDHWGLCPFCDDGSNPSFSVSEQKQFYYCFKCRETGNVISFLKLHQGYNFVESVEALASRAGLEVPFQDSGKETKSNEPLYKAMEAAKVFYQKNLSNSSSAQLARKYLLEERKLSGSSCKKFCIGLAQDSWDSLTRFLLSEGFKENDLIDAGLSKRNKDSKLYDVFRNRIIFPIKDRKGRVVGFGGRVLDSKDVPKYLNTGETSIFQKGKELYGLHEFQDYRRDYKEIIVVEGYMDVIAMSENGFNNAVATLGIATNRFHTQKLVQIVNKIVFCFDGDDAGRGAAWGALKNSLPTVSDGIEISFLFLPEGHDPASILEENKDGFKDLKKNSLLLSEYFMQRLTEASSVSTLEEKAHLASRAMSLLSGMPESSIKKLLEKEVSRITGLSVEDLESQKKPNSRIRVNRVNNNEVSSAKEFDASSIASKALSALIHNPKLVSQIEDYSWLGTYKDPEVKLMLSFIEFFKAQEGLVITDFFSELDAESSSFIGTLLATTEPLEEKNSKEYLLDCLKGLRKLDSVSRIGELKHKFHQEYLTEEETFELQQHLIANLENLHDDDKEFLRNLSQKS